ncbi:hypothetical protein INT45_002206 [Circinella minor]|uniref:Uncharacterized protein n=1 Tax=Circinella minor TaxID=1195481 RepID=A0A8H7SFZ5_9FUNG|nr:hypothetical protein INT45_002206 [Circinella minor]
MELEIIQTQNVLTTRLNKRLREESDVDYNENSQQSSQESIPSVSTYDPDSQSSEDSDDTLEPMWMLNNINLSRILSEFRVTCYKKYLYQQSLTVTEKMAVNRIYLMNQANDCFTYCSGLNDIKTLLPDFFGLNKHYRKASDEELLFINEIAYNKAAGLNLRAKQLVIEQLMNTGLETHATVFYDLIKNHEACFELSTADESVFIDHALSPFVKAVFPVTHMLQKSGHFTSLEGNMNIKPDIKFHISINGDKFDCLLFEVKCPRSSSEDDLFKLSVEMQYILNRLIEHGAANPVVYGVLVYGHTCSIYKMALVGPKVYVMIKMKVCFLPRSFEDLHVAIHTLSCFIQLRDLVCDEVQSIIKTKGARSPIISWTQQAMIDINQK